MKITPAESYQVARSIRKLGDALRLLAAARSSMGLLSPAALVELGLVDDLRKLGRMADELSGVRHRLGYNPPARVVEPAKAEPPRGAP